VTIQGKTNQTSLNVCITQIFLNLIYSGNIYNLRNRRYKVYKESCVQCSEEIKSFENDLQKIKKKYFSHDSTISKSQMSNIIFDLKLEKKKSKTHFVHGNYSFANFNDFKTFLDTNYLIPKFSTLLTIQDILKNKTEITVEFGVRFRIAGDHPVEDKLAGRNAGICVRCAIKDKPDAYMLSHQHSICPTECNPKITAANSYPIRTLKRSFENNKNLHNYFEHESKKMKYEHCRAKFSSFEHQESLPILFIEMIENALRDFHDILNEAKHLKSLIRQICRDFAAFLREKGALPMFNEIYLFCLDLKSKIEKLDKDIKLIETTSLVEAKKNVSSLKSRISYYNSKLERQIKKRALKKDLNETSSKIDGLQETLLQKQKILIDLNQHIIKKKRQLFKLNEDLENSKISFTNKDGPFEEKFNKTLTDLGIQDGLFNNGISAYTLFKEREKILSCLDQREFKTSEGTSFISPPNNFTKNLILSYMTKIYELNQCTKPSVGSMCSHDIERVTKIVIDLGKMYHLLVPLKVRHSAHQRLAHTVEYFLHHGDNLPSERPCEHNHQFLKKADRETIYVRNSRRLEQIIAIAIENMQKSWK
jgi:hypothetical protein